MWKENSTARRAARVVMYSFHLMSHHRLTQKRVCYILCFFFNDDTPKVNYISVASSCTCQLHSPIKNANWERLYAEVSKTIICYKTLPSGSDYVLLTDSVHHEMSVSLNYRTPLDVGRHVQHTRLSWADMVPILKASPIRTQQGPDGPRERGIRYYTVHLCVRNGSISYILLFKDTLS